ncbi:MAG: Unknown protein [uncultured Campylobacterales bacterium]|uniref:DNA-damage-inducible protein J n=1 Tax=uncultured Campylobacterales bacterium TaxID=352960 RepID=A0A6S6SAR5_9BACT|nr:MAG: Unknown protein [uncultured Campylobacterales bacterium]
MSTKIQTSLRIDKIAYQDAKSILGEMGMNFSEAVNIFTKMVVNNRGLPFEVKIVDEESIKLNKRLQIALSEVAVIQNNNEVASNARDFLDEL